ncbi:MAG: hypothetical protein IT211_05240 [Armatimonadetes bacterium]|nr:hypothetical protein [Armatimonadota bacterium]
MKAKPLIAKILERADRVWLQNPWTIVEFIGQLIRAFPHALADIGSARWRSTTKEFGRVLIRSVVRSFLPVLGLVAVVVWSIGELSHALGPVTRSTFEQSVLPLLLETIIPIVLATVITARQGATLVAKYLAGVGQWIKHPTESTEGLIQLQREVMPRVVGGVVASVIFHLLLCWGLLFGYLSQGNLAEVSAVPFHTVVEFVRQHELQSNIYLGTARSAASALMIVLIASALGMRGGRRVDSPQAGQLTDPEDRYDAAWESSVMSLLLSFLIAFLP